MIPYFALLVIPFILQLLLSSQHKEIRIRNTNIIIKGATIALPTFFMLFLLLLALRDDTIGRDLSNYKYAFQKYGQEDFSVSYLISLEWLFRLYCWFIYNFISRNFQVFLAITAVLTVLPIEYIYNQNKEHGYMKIAIFVNMSTFIMVFSGIRQGLAMAVGMLAYEAVRRKQVVVFLFWVIVALSIHHTGFMILFMMPLYWIRFKKRDLLWIIPLFIFAFAFTEPIFNFITSYLGDVNEHYAVRASSTGAFGSMLLFALFALFCFFIPDEQYMDAEAFGLRNILVFSVIIQSFAMVNMLAMRMNYYFILLIPIAVGKSLDFEKSQYKQVARLGEIVISVFFTFNFFYGIYHSYQTGISTLDTIPYIPFWKG